MCDLWGYRLNLARSTGVARPHNGLVSTGPILLEAMTRGAGYPPSPPSHTSSVCMVGAVLGGSKGLQQGGIR